jgi:transcriptional regulator with XRE-family HTH domain
MFPEVFRMINGTMQIFAENMKTLMISRKVSYRKLAAGTGISIGSLHAYAEGKTIVPLPRAKIIATYFGLSVDDMAERKVE